MLVSLIMLLTSTINTTYGFIVTKTDSIINTFTPFDSIISNLLINKSVEHPFGDEYVIPDNIAFDFKMDFGSVYANTTIKTTNGDIAADKNGSIQITVKPGKTFAVEGIDAGTKVTVTEIQKDGSGFTVKDGSATMEGVVAEDGSLKFSYINVYNPISISPVNVFISGTKILEGRQWQKGDSFSFKLEQEQTDSSWSPISTKTVTYDAGNASFNHFDFSDAIHALAFDKVGIYTFRITEVVGELENVDYDKSVNTFAIKVTDVDMDGKLEINTVTAQQNASVKEIDGKYTISVKFNNTFIPVIPDPEDISVKIDVDKTVKNTGSSSIGPAGFEFVLENTVSGEKLALKTDENGDAAFSLPFTAADVGKIFTYRLSEINGGMAGVTYDTKVYDISIAIALGNDNKLVASITMNGEKVDKAIASFENIYHTELPAPDETSVVITANKTVKNTGTAKIGSEGFEFVLENTVDGEKLILVSNAEGKAIFTLPYTAKDIGKTYTYTLSETDKGAAGVTYDATVYTISISISLSDNNKLIANVIMNGQMIENPVAEFVNTYHANLSDSPQTGDNSNITFWFIMMIISGTACIVLVLLDKRYARKKH